MQHPLNSFGWTLWPVSQHFCYQDPPHYILVSRDSVLRATLSVGASDYSRYMAANEN